MTTPHTPTPTVTAGDLRPVVAALAKVVKKNAALPVLQCVKVETVSRNILRLTGTGDDTFFTADLRADAPAKAEPFLVPLSRLQDRIRGAKATEPIPLHPTKTPPVSDFPEPPRFRSRPVILEPPVIEALRQALACGSADPTRHVLQGACLDPGKEGCRIIGTDGRHLFASAPFQLAGLRESIILPALEILPRILVRLHYPLNLRLLAPKNESSWFQLEGRTWSLIGRTVEGNYPKYRQVIPADADFKTRVDLPESVLEPLAQAIGRMPGKALANRPVGLRMMGETVSLLAREANDDAYEELQVPAAGSKGPAAILFVNRDYLAKAFQFGMTRIEIVDDCSPVKCSGKTGLMIIMPVRGLGAIEVKHTSTLSVPETGPQPRPKREPNGVTKAAPSTVNAVVSIAAPKQDQRSMKRTPEKPPDAVSTKDPVEYAASQINEIKDALKAAVSGLNGLTASLRATRQQQRQAEREVRAVRSTLRSLRQVKI